jgi:hypothetical protein
MKKIETSETIVIKRSKINFAPYNPKKHTKEAIKDQINNILRVGFLGGIVWNDQTGNLISGHKRVMAFDLHYKYDGTEQKDYEIKVERVSFDEKTEKEQNIYMDAVSKNTRQDYSLIAEIEDIDFKLAGLDDNDLNMMSVFNENITVDSRNELFGDIDTIVSDENKLKDEKKQQVKDAKKKYKESVNQRNMGGAYVTLSFDDVDNKKEFMNMFGFNPDDLFIKGELMVNKINEL